MTAAASAAERARALLGSVAERAAWWRHGQWYWGDAIAVDGRLEAASVAGLSLDDLAVQVDHWARSAPPTWDDSLVAARAVFALGRDGMVAAAAVERAADALSRLPRTLEGIPLLRPQVPEWRNLVWVDSLYHLPVGLATAPGADQADAVAVALATMEVLRLERGVAHCYDAGLRRANGVAWTRGVGWALLGLLDLAEAVATERREPLVAEARRLLGDLAGEQRDDGHWPTALGDPEAAPESSTAAFVVAAALHPQAPEGALPAAVLARAAGAVLAAVADDGAYAGVSADTHAAWDSAAYRHPPTRPSPWGQGAALRALVALVRTEDAPAVETPLDTNGTTA